MAPGHQAVVKEPKAGDIEVSVSEPYEKPEDSVSEVGDTKREGFRKWCRNRDYF
jgi:hypothetical protein